MRYIARNFMSRHPALFSPEMDMLEAVDLMVTKGVSGGPVVDRTGNLVGVLSEIDCLDAAITATYHDSFGGKVKEFMRPDVKTVDVDEAITHVAKKFASDEFYYYRGFPVMKNNRVVGRITLRNVLRALEEMGREESKAGSSF